MDEKKDVVKKDTKHTHTSRAVMRARKTGNWIQYFRAITFLTKLDHEDRKNAKRST